MTARLCRVSITDRDGSSHFIDVTASSLFEAVALALKSKGGGSTATDGFRPIKVFEPKVEYEVKLKDFMTWLDRRGRTPREVIDRKKIRDILGLSRPF
jgi:hypothetical protein